MYTVYCSCNQETNFSMETDSITIGIELWRIPQISEHCKYTTIKPYCGLKGYFSLSINSNIYTHLTNNITY